MLFIYQAPECNCNVDGSVDSKCDPETGKCECKCFVGGINCDTCLRGYHSFPNCTGNFFLFFILSQKLDIFFI